MGDGTEKNPFTSEDVLEAIKKNGGTAKGLDLSGKYFEKVIDLNGLDLQGIILKEASLESANLKGSGLWGAHLEGASLIDANLKEAELGHAKLDKADLRFAHFEGADLIGVEFPRDTKLDDIYWEDYILYRENSGEFGSAISTYRSLKTWYTEHGIYDIAGKFFYREMEAKRKSQNWKRDPLSKLWGWTMRLLCGYGEKPERVVISAIVVVFGLTLAYYFLGSFDKSSLLGSLYYSVVSFVALGYGNWAPQPTGWAKGMGAAEAVIGVFMMALFLVTFTRKMTR